MKSLGPLYVGVVTVDAALALLFLAVNIAFAAALTALAFRGRPWADRWLIFLGLCVLTNAVGLAATSCMARTPIRDVEVFTTD